MSLTLATCTQGCSKYLKLYIYIATYFVSHVSSPPLLHFVQTVRMLKEESINVEGVCCKGNHGFASFGEGGGGGGG